MQGNANIAVEQALSDVTTQYREVLRLEESVNELSELFIDLAILIEQQGVLLDTIESNVKVAGGYVDEGNNQLGKAIISLRNRRKCCCYICTVIVIIIGIVALVIYIKLSN